MQSYGMDRLTKINSLIKAAAVMFGTLLFQILLQVVFGMIIGALSGQSITENEAAGSFYYKVYEPVYHILYGVTAGLTALFIYNIYYRGKQDSFYCKMFKRKYLSKCAKRIVIFVLFGMAMQLLAYCVLNMFYLFAVDSPLFKSYAAVSDKLSGRANPLIFLYTLIFAPFAEEYIFRGLIYGSVRKGFGCVAANIIQAFLFALYHGNMIQGIYAFVLGLLLGYAAEHKKCMSEIVGLHMVVNISGLFIVPVFINLLCGAVGSYVSFIIGTVVSLACIGWVIVSGIIKPKD